MLVVEPIKLTFWVLVTLTTILCNAHGATADELGPELRKLNGMMQGDQTPLDEVDRVGNELLKKYTEPEEQGKIYYQLALLHAMSGMTRPEKMIEYVRRAHDFPLEPPQRLQLYVYWGDAIQIQNAGVLGDALADKRKLAVSPYLEGLKELAQYNLPETKPKLRGVFKAVAPEGSPGYEEMVKEHEQALAAAYKAILERKLIDARDTLTGQIVYLYTRRPLATEELEELATQKLQDAAAVDRLMKAVKTAIDLRMEKLAAVEKSVPPKRSSKKDKSAQSKDVLPSPQAQVDQTSYWGLWILAIILTVIAIFVIVVMRRPRKS